MWRPGNLRKEQAAETPPNLSEPDARLGNPAAHNPRSPLPDARRVRTIQDRNGLAWTVSEKTLPGDGNISSLLFVSDYAVRRVRNYPSNWFDLPSAELFAVSLGR